MGNVFIIGNGFDLDLGLPTKYSDFANSEFWPKASTRSKVTFEEMKREMEQGIFLTIPETPKLEHAIEDAKKTHGSILKKNYWIMLKNTTKPIQIIPVLVVNHKLK